MFEHNYFMQRIIISTNDIIIDIVCHKMVFIMAR
jgi:hypothetical protein